MNIAEYSVKNRVTTWLLVIILMAGGFTAMEEIGRLEDPEFTIKDAKVITYYPGATPEEVDREVTYHVEDAVQQLEQLKEITSFSADGYSEVTITIKNKYRKPDFPQIWDELRRKINDMQSKLPPGAYSSVVVDDFGDVYGVFLALTGDGYSYRDLKDYADLLKEELILVPGVRKIVVDGDIQEQVYVEISRARLAELGVPLESITAVLRSQNLVASAGNVRVGNDYIRIQPTGEFTSVQQMGELIISSSERRLIRLKDIAEIRRVYDEVPSNYIYFNGKPALTLGISMLSGENVVAVGQRLDKRFQELQVVTPVGMQLSPIYNQPKIVDQAVGGFILSVAQALIIVVVVLLFFMGLRTGLIIGAVLLITVSGTVWFMNMFGFELQRISLGALIIALGMLVDNAIVVAEGMLVRIKQGQDGTKAAREVVSQTMWPLLGGTIVGILAFQAIGLSDDSTGEFANSLFWVILISLLLSWFTAVSTTPLLCVMFMKPDKNAGQGEPSDPYAGGIFQAYKGFLAKAIHYRKLTIMIVVGLFALSIFGFGYVKNSFFPDSNTPMFYVDLWEIEGTDIRHTRDDVLKVVEYLHTLDEVTSTATFVGGGASRYTLVYDPESANDAYAQIIVQTELLEQIDDVEAKVAQFMSDTLPNTEPKTKRLRIGPGRDAKIEARFSGPDPAVLRELSEQAQEIFFADSNTKDVRDDWRQPVKVIKPLFNEQTARQLGITRADIALALESAFEGSQVGIYRDGIRLLPIYVIPPEQERLDVANIESVRVYSRILQRTVPISQVVSGFDTVWEDAKVRREDRQLTITASCNPVEGLASPVFERLRPQIEAMTLPAGYSLEWGGEYEDQSDAQGALFSTLPAGFLIMIIVVILLFGKVRQPLIIWLTVPLAVIGITAGLLITGGAFDFMALLGALSLTGLLIKNAIVLIEQIDLEIEEGKEPYQAVLESSVSRMRPVMMAASTTILGMIPLLPDVFFVNMALTIMFGLGFASVLTLIVVPVLYTMLFKIKPAAP